MSCATLLTTSPNRQDRGGHGHAGGPEQDGAVLREPRHPLQEHTPLLLLGPSSSLTCFYKDDNGPDTDISRVLGDPNRPYDKGVYMFQDQRSKVRRSARRGEPVSPLNSPPLPGHKQPRRGANHDPSHLIMSHQNGTDVWHVCGHPMSYGWDIASPGEGLFFDMEHKSLYPLCTGGIKEECFDIQTRTLVGGKLEGRDGAEVAKWRFGRRYETTAHWEN